MRHHRPLWRRIRPGHAQYSGGPNRAAERHAGFQLSIGGVPTTATYSGLAPNYTGLYQFNITVPDVAAGTVPVTFTLNGVYWNADAQSRRAELASRLTPAAMQSPGQFSPPATPAPPPQPTKLPQSPPPPPDTQRRPFASRRITCFRVAPDPPIDSARPATSPAAASSPA